MGIKDRLYAFLAYKNLKASKFEQACGLGNGFCGKIGDNITDGSLSLIEKAFPTGSRLASATCYVPKWK